jgi:hypothetical protein
MVMTTPTRAVVKQLTALFQRNGYVRRLNPQRRAAEPQTYKKGDEVRLVAESQAELRAIRRLLRAAGFTPGRAFRKAKQWRQPLYGRDAVARFLALVGEEGNRA